MQSNSGTFIAGSSLLLLLLDCSFESRFVLAPTHTYTHFCVCNRLLASAINSGEKVKYDGFPSSSPDDDEKTTIQCQVTLCTSTAATAANCLSCRDVSLRAHLFLLISSSSLSFGSILFLLLCEPHCRPK